MNYIKHLTGFFEKVANERTFNATHVSLYISLFQFWNYNRFRSPISISRDELMRISKISSKATYHKCMKGLHANSYIKYEPSYNPFKGSQVYMFNFADDLKPLTRTQKSTCTIFNSANEQVLNKRDTGNVATAGQVVEQALVPYINSTNNLNNLNIINGVNSNQQNQKIEDDHINFNNDDYPGKEKSSAKKEKLETFADHKAERSETSRQKSTTKKESESIVFRLSSREPATDFIPNIEEIKSYFLKQSFPELEAQKFFNHYASNGWLIGGKSPMVDFKAAAENWMINAVKFQIAQSDDRAMKLNIANNKNYAEPL